MQHIAFCDFFNQQEFKFYKLRTKRTNWLYFQFFIVWTRHINHGRIYLQSVFALEFGICLDSNLVSRVMMDLWINLAPKKRLKALTFNLVNEAPSTSRELILQPVAETHIEEFKKLDQNTQTNLLQTVQNLAAGERLSEIRERNWTIRPFQNLKKLGSRLQDWLINSKANIEDAVGIAIDEKMIRKAFDLGRHRKLTSHWVSRCKTYLPSIMVEVAALLRPKRLAEVVGHFFPYPQKNYDDKGKYQPLRKNIYLVPFLEKLHQYFGNLIMLADANYATKKFISWFHGKNWQFIMRLNSSQKYLLADFQATFDMDPDKISINKWVEAEEFGGKIRILGYRRKWKDAKGTRKEKRYFLITTVDWENPRDIWRFYRLRWTLENTFKALPVLDRTPGMNIDLFRGFFALSLHVLAPICYQTQSNSRTLARLLDLQVIIEEKKIVWQNISTHFARRLLQIGYYRSTEFLCTEVEI